MGLTECLFLHILDMHAGALGTEVTRQSIPNLAVKLYSGDNTVGGALWENSSAPAANYATITENKLLSLIIDHYQHTNTYVHFLFGGGETKNHCSTNTTNYLG